MTRQLYPHDGSATSTTPRWSRALDAKAKRPPELVELVKNGVAALDQAKHVPFLQLSEGYQTEVLQGMETDPFFQTVRGHTVVALYNNQNLWPTSAIRAARSRTAATCSAASRTWAGPCSPTPRPARRHSWVEGGQRPWRPSSSTTIRSW